MAIGCCLVALLCLATPTFIRVPFSIVLSIIIWGFLIKKGIDYLKGE